MIIKNFYEVAFLVKEDYFIAKVDKDENGKTQYHFNGGDKLNSSRFR